MTFKNKVIWVTGASSGIGEGLALKLANEDCKLILSSRRKDALIAVKNKCNHSKNIAVLPFDLLDVDNMKTIAKNAINIFGKIDILINNGGVSQRSLIINTDISVDRKIIEVDYLGTIALTKALLPYFIEQKFGHFVTVTSLMGKFGSPYRSGYCGAKHALHGFFDVLRMEHEKDNIQVTIVCPGFVNTNVAINALTGDGSKQNKQDSATQNGLNIETFTKKMLQSIYKQKFEVYIGKKEVLGVYLKRFFPKILHWLVLRSKIR